MLHKDAYIDLPGFELPFTHSDIFTEQDYEILESTTVLKESVKTKNMLWIGGDGYNTNITNRKVSLMAFITDKEFQKQLKQYYRQTFRRDIIEIERTSLLTPIISVSLITFSGTTPWHREGFNPAWTNSSFESKFRSIHSLQRFNYAINYPFYLNDSEKTKVEFAKTSGQIKDIEKSLSIKMLDNKSHEEIDQGIKISSALDQIIDEDRWKDNIEVIGVKNGYDCPYIINLSSYHKVTSSDATRLSLRFMGSAKYNWKNIEDFYNNNELFLNV